MLWVPKFVIDADAYTSSHSGSWRPAKRAKPSRMNRHLASRERPGVRLVVAIAPAFTMGFVRPSGLCSMLATELKVRPVGDRNRLTRFVTWWWRADRIWIRLGIDKHRGVTGDRKTP
jgi:hypothetical protein